MKKTMMITSQSGTPSNHNKIPRPMMLLL